MKRITCEVLAHEIKEYLIMYGLDFQDCRRQGYDGATNMSGTNGVQGRLAAENFKARHEAYENFSLLYVHLVDVMEAICEHDTSYGEMNWDNKTIGSANGLSKIYHSFSFVISLCQLHVHY